MRRWGWLLAGVLLLGAAPPERPLYYERPIAPADLEGRSLRELSLLRNTIYARVGNPFRKRWLHSYFTALPWYHELPAPELAKLSQLDKQNAELIEKAESTVPRDELLKRKGALLAAHQLSSADFTFVEFVAPGLLTQAGDELVLWSVPGGQRMASAKLPPNQRLLWAVAQPDGALRLLIAPPQGVARGTWTPGAPPAIEKPLLTDRYVESAVMPATGDVGLVAANSSLRRVDFKKRRSTDTTLIPPSLPFAMSALADGSLLSVPDYDGVTLLPVVGKRVRIQNRPSENDLSTLSPDGKTLFTTHAGHTLVRGPAEPKGKLETFPGDTGELLRIAATDDGDVLEASIQAVSRFGPKGQSWRMPIPVHVQRAAFSPGFVAAAGADHVLRLLDAKTGAAVPEWMGPSPLSADDAVELVLLSRALGQKVPAFVPNGDADRNPLDDVELLDTLLAVEQLKDLSRRDLKLLRHTISARRGKAFTVALLRDYFATKGWYRADPNFAESKLTPVDQKNLKIVASLEEDLGGPLPDNLDHEPMQFRG